MRVNHVWSGLKPYCAINQRRWSAVCAVVLAMAASLFSQSTDFQSTVSPRPRITQEIDGRSVVTLHGNVRRDLTTGRDMGVVEDGLQLHLYLVLQRSPEQQTALDNLLARQQQPTAPEYHKWLTPQQYGQRFGASTADIAKISAWLETQGMHVNGVTNNAMFIDFSASASQVREVFGTPLHYYNIQGGKYAANAQDPVIPAALAPVVAGIKGLSKIPRQSHHTKAHRPSDAPASHLWNRLGLAGDSPVKARAPLANAGVLPADDAGNGEYDVTPQDYYTIYNVNPVFTGGNLGAGATVAVIEESDFEFGTVDSTTGVASGGDVVTFRTLFGVRGALNMHVYHGYGSVGCSAPGIDPSHNGEEAEAALDAEWANALAPAANLIFMSCDSNADQGVESSLMALIDNNMADSMSMSYGTSEIGFTTADYTTLDALYAQAAAQGQSLFVSSGDSGSDVNDPNTLGTATFGVNVNAFGSSPNVTVTGGTDFSDMYDANEGGPLQSTYWGATNSATYGSALGYVPETAWNDSCASSIGEAFAGSYTGAGYCAVYVPSPLNGGWDMVGGSGGFSTQYPVPSYQSGITGYSGTMRAQPDISGFAANGDWNHALVFCDSYNGQSYSPCTSLSDVSLGGGTSFVAPTMAGVAGLLRTQAGGRQGLLNPELYALAQAQFTAAATATACYSNGQTSNTGVTTGLPAEACIFNDVTTGNNDVPCALGSTNCYVNSGAQYGMLSLNGAASLGVAYPSTPGYDEATGIGSVNVANLLAHWNGTTATFFTSTTTLAAAPTSIASTASTILTANVTGGTPTGFSGTPPALSGSVKFFAGSTALGSCTLNASGSCTQTVNGAALQSGSNSITAMYSGNSSYPASVSIPPVGVTVTGGVASRSGYTLSASSSSVSIADGNQASVTLNLGSTGYAGTVSFATKVTLNGASTIAVTAFASPANLENGIASSTLTVTANMSAEKQAPRLPWKNGGGRSGGVLVFAVLLSAPFTLRRKRVLAVLLTALTLLAAGFLISCGGGSKSSSSTPTPQATARTYIVTVTPMGNPVSPTNPPPVTIAVTVP
jgi:hypothetical protein